MPDTEETPINDYHCHFYYLHRITAVSILWFLKKYIISYPSRVDGKAGVENWFQDLCDCEQREILMLYLKNFSND